MPDIPDQIIEFGTDTTRTIANLVFSGTTVRFPDIRFIFSHAGGTMPFLVERLQLLPSISPKLKQGGTSRRSPPSSPAITTIRRRRPTPVRCRR